MRFGERFINEVIKNAGNESSITFATVAAGRGKDIILSDKSKANGGLHVIIACEIPNLRSLEQLIGRFAIAYMAL